MGSFYQSTLLVMLIIFIATAFKIGFMVSRNHKYNELNNAKAQTVTSCPLRTDAQSTQNNHIEGTASIICFANNDGNEDNFKNSR